MIRIAVLGDMGSGKSYLANLFNYPVFNADQEVTTLYKKNKKCFKSLKKVLPKYIYSYPIKKKEISNAILKNQKNIKKIVKIVHPYIRARMHNFLKKNKKKKFVILDVPLYLENKLNKKDDVLIFVDAKKREINRRLKKRKNFSEKLKNKLKKIQLPLEIKKKKSNYIVKNNFKNKSMKKNVKKVLKEILDNV